MPFAAKIVAALVVAVLAQAIALAPFPANARGNHGDATRPARFNAARSWGYQLQYLDVATLKDSPYDVLVIDYSKDGSEAQALTSEDLARLKRKPDGSARIVLAYLSIGEAETYRYYWHWSWGGSWYGRLLGFFTAPAWLGSENGEWGGNYAVRYWQDDWQRVVLGDGGYLDRIVAAGFDGVYLDKIDSSIESVARGRSTAKADMRAFVVRIAERARQQSAGFLVVPQNGEELLDDPAYLAVISGTGKEDLLYGEMKDKAANTADIFARRVAMMTPLRRAGKPVLAVEYIDNPDQITAARATLEKLGYVPHFADRDLGRLRIGDLPDARQPSGRRRRSGWPF